MRELCIPMKTLLLYMSGTFFKEIIRVTEWTLSKYYYYKAVVGGPAGPAMAGLVFGHTKKFHMYTRTYFKYPIGCNFLFYRLEF